MPRLPLLLLAALTLGGEIREDDVVYLNSGKSAEGQLVYHDDQRLVLRKGSREEVIARGDVKSVDARSLTLDDLLERTAALGPLASAPVDGLLELATFAANGRLAGEARLLRLRALLTDPANAPALEALGGRVRGKTPAVKLEGDWIDVDQLEKHAEGRWKDRWTFDTLHYELQANLPLDAAIAAAFDAERLFDAFYELFGTELELREPYELMDVQIHADDGSYPEPSDRRRGSFDPSDRILHVNAATGGWEPAFVHELVRQLCYETTERARSGRGKVPRWLAAGLGESLASGLGGTPGELTFDLGSVNYTHLRRHGQSDDPFDLNRVVSFTDEDFTGGADLDLKYAQSYSLVQFCLYGDEGIHHEGFVEFMRHCWQGKSSISTFREDLGIAKTVEFERAWLEWVKRTARLN